MQLGYDYEGWLFPPPISTLPIELQREITQFVPKDWVFPQKSSEAWFLLSAGERELGLTLLKESVLEGDYRTAVHALMSRSVTKEQRTEIARSWVKGAERTTRFFGLFLYTYFGGQGKLMPSTLTSKRRSPQ